MYRFAIFLIYVITHFMTGNAKTFGIGYFQRRVKASPEYDARDKQYRT